MDYLLWNSPESGIHSVNSYELLHMITAWMSLYLATESRNTCYRIYGVAISTSGSLHDGRHRRLISLVGMRIGTMMASKSFYLLVIDSGISHIRLQSCSVIGVGSTVRGRGCGMRPCPRVISEREFLSGRTTTWVARGLIVVVVRKYGLRRRSGGVWMSWGTSRTEIPRMRFLGRMRMTRTRNRFDLSGG
jgi:hypothetical protein